MATSSGRIAVVEDDSLVREMLDRVLTSAGYGVELFSSGTEFVESRRSSSFDVVVTDLQMEGEQAAILSEDGTIRPTDFSFAHAGGRPARREGAPKDISRERIEEALRESGGNRVQAARALGVSRATFYRLLERPAKPAGAPEPEPEPEPTPLPLPLDEASDEDVEP